MAKQDTYTDVAAPVSGDFLLGRDVSDLTQNAAGSTVEFAVAAFALKDGTPVANRVAYWSGANTLGHEAGFTYDPATDTLTVSKVVIGNITLDGQNQLADPDAHRLMGWNDTSATSVWVTVGSGLSFDGTTLSATGGGSGDVTKVGTPVAGRMAYWTGDGTLGHEANFTYDATNDRLTITTTAPAASLVPSDTQLFISKDADFVDVVVAVPSDTADHRPVINLLRSRGLNAGAPAAVADNDYLGTIQFRGFDTSGSTQICARIEAKVDGTPGTSSVPAEILFATGSTVGNVTDRLSIGPTGTIKHLNNSFVEVAENAQTASYTLALTDTGKYVSMSVASANNVTIPANATVAFPVGVTIVVQQIGAGATSILPASGVTLNGVLGDGTKKGTLSAQWSSVSLLKTGTDTWRALGAIGTVA